MFSRHWTSLTAALITLRLNTMSWKVTAIGGSTLLCKGWLPMHFTINNWTTIQPLYFCDKVTQIYFSKTSCGDHNILPVSFPYPMPTAKKINHRTNFRIYRTYHYCKSWGRLSMQLTAYKVWLLFLKIDVIRILKKLTFPLWGVVSWWKNALEGVKLGCW